MGAKNLPNLNNLAMELRKVCCHPVRSPAVSVTGSPKHMQHRPARCLSSVMV